MKIIAVLISIFILAIAVRFLYFSQNVYFAYDQARDAYFALNILKGDLRLIGPPSAASPNLFPGPLSLYLYSFILAFGKNPEYLSVFFRIYNALGIFLVYLIGAKLFDKKVGFLSSALYAISYEQSQYSLFMSHQPLAVLPVLMFYLGLTIFIFEKNAKGLILFALGLGLAIQFHFVYIFLFPIVLLTFLFFRKSFKKVKTKHLLAMFIAFLLPVSTYILSEIKFGFRLIRSLFTVSSETSLHLNEALGATLRFLHDTFLENYDYTLLVLLLLIIAFGYLIFKTRHTQKALFLLVWFLGGILPYFFSGTTSYYYSAGASVSILILSSFLAFRLYSKYPALSFLLIASVVVNNQNLIKKQNPQGPNRDIVIQEGMVIKTEKKVLDYVYGEAHGNPFAVRALTIPLNVATTWSYLFEWYGKEKYGYLPIWSEKPAEGFPGTLPYQTARSVLPETQFIIIEPTVGINQGYVEDYFKEENYFTKSVEEKQFGTIKVQKRMKI